MTSTGKDKPSQEPGPEGRRPGGLPESYGETEAVLLPRDPHWLLLYWEIAGAAEAEARRTLGGDVFDQGRPSIRVREAGTDAAPERLSLIEVPTDADRWYINVRDGGECRCEVGRLLPDGSFTALAASNAVLPPPGRVSDTEDERWLTAAGGFEKLLQLSGVEYAGRGSGEIARSLAQRWKMLRSVFSRAASWGGEEMLSRRREQKRGFRLAADCELVLYGATEPDALVTVSGRKVELDGNGSFSMRFALPPDGTMELPVRAFSPDGAEARGLSIKITRETVTDER